MDINKPKEYEFITEVIDWMRRPMNYTVVEYHRSCMQTMTDRKFREEIKIFLKQRFYMVYTVYNQLKIADMPRGFLGRAATMYIKDVL